MLVCISKNQRLLHTDNADEQTNPDSGKASEADKSALAAINRALRMAELFRERALSATGAEINREDLPQVHPDYSEQ